MAPLQEKAEDEEVDSAQASNGGRRPSLPDPHLSVPPLPPIRAKRRERTGEDIRWVSSSWKLLVALVRLNCLVHLTGT